jgi:hypothetical protein
MKVVTCMFMDLEHSTHYRLKLNNKFRDTIPEIRSRVQVLSWIKVVLVSTRTTGVK